MPIATFRTLVLDCPDPQALGAFYAGLLGGTPEHDPDVGWVEIIGGPIHLAFQLAPDHQPPAWPDPEKPQQYHLDVTVTDVDAAEEQVLALGATKPDHQPGADEDGNWRVYLDPAGHPFCLCWDVD